MLPSVLDSHTCHCRAGVARCYTCRSCLAIQSLGTLVETLHICTLEPCSSAIGQGKPTCNVLLWIKSQPEQPYFLLILQLALHQSVAQGTVLRGQPIHWYVNRPNAADSPVVHHNLALQSCLGITTVDSSSLTGTQATKKKAV